MLQTQTCGCVFWGGKPYLACRAHQASYDEFERQQAQAAPCDGGSIEVTVERAASANKTTGIKIKVIGDSVQEIETKLGEAIAAALNVTDYLPPVSVTGAEQAPK